MGAGVSVWSELKGAAAAKAESLFGNLVARLKSCPDASRGAWCLCEVVR
jgi:hypothetical protein